MRISKRVEISWNKVCEEAMLKLKDKISNESTNDPFLELPRFG